jgi:hypothetical protein
VSPTVVTWRPRRIGSVRGFGTFSTDVANTVHWDGARTGEKEPAVILLTGMGPVRTVQVDENGKPLPPGGRGKE